MMLLDTECFHQREFRTEPVGDFGPLIGTFYLASTAKLARHRTEVQRVNGYDAKVALVAAFMAGQIHSWDFGDRLDVMEIDAEGVMSLPEPVFLQLKAIITGELPSLPPQYQPDFPGMDKPVSAVWSAKMQRDREHRTRIQNRTLTSL